MIAVVLCVVLPVVALALLDWERVHRPRQVVQRDPLPHVQIVPAERVRSLAQDAYDSHVVDSLAGGTTIEAGFWRAQRSVASDRTFGDQALRRTR